MISIVTMSRKFQSNLNVWCKIHISVCRWHLPMEITLSLFPLIETVSHVTAANLSIWCLDLSITPTFFTTGFMSNEIPAMLSPTCFPGESFSTLHDPADLCYFSPEENWILRLLFFFFFYWFFIPFLFLLLICVFPLCFLFALFPLPYFIFSILSLFSEVTSLLAFLTHF